MHATTRRLLSLFPMVAPRCSSRYVPVSYLDGASCLLPAHVFAEREILSLPRPTFASDPVLTPAESRVLAHLLRGLCNKEIAGELNRAEATVKNQVASILHKYGVPSRARLMAVLR